MMLEIDSKSVPRNDWSRFQCVVWIKCFLEERLNWDSERAMAFAVRFREMGSVMVRMGRGDMWLVLRRFVRELMSLRGWGWWRNFGDGEFGY